MTKTGELLWTPSSSRVATAEIEAFRQYVNRSLGKQCASYDELYQWSLAETGTFWQAIADFCGVVWQHPATTPYSPPPDGQMLGARWFDGSRLNFAENLLAPVIKDPQRELIVSHAEGRESVSWRGDAFLMAVARCAQALRAAGVRPGDRVVGLIANVPEALIAMLATASCGAIWASCSPDFGAAAAIDRFSQVTPKVIFYTTAYVYGGKRFSTTKTVRELLQALDVELAIAIDHLGEAIEAITGIKIKQVAWQDFLGKANPELVFEPRRFDDPQYILFSSGTTGVPKCIVHGVGGTLLQHLKELRLHSDIKASDRLLFYTTCGWMMWNWMASALACGASLALYEGSPAFPRTDELWRCAGKLRVTHLGLSPKYLSACTTADVSPKNYLNGMPLRAVLATGAPLLPEQFAWVYREVATDLHLASISGGTDIVSCFMLGVPTLPVRAGEIQRPGLGMAIAAWDENAEPVRDRKGELVCTQPFPSMPIGFWQDGDGHKYRQAYFNHYQREVWRHGDFVEINPTGGIVVFGRSDATLNPGGIRIGTAELYRQVEAMTEVADSLAIGYEIDGDTEIWLFVKLRVGYELDTALTDKIKATIKAALTPRHVPKRVIAVQDIPYTRSGKKVELAVTDAVHGRTVSNLAALANPEAIAEFLALGRAKLT